MVSGRIVQGVIQMIEFSEKFLQLWRSVFNKELYTQNKRIEIIEEAKELPSPLPRLSLNNKFLDELDILLEKYYPGVKMVDVTNTNSMEPTIDNGHKVVLIPFLKTPEMYVEEGDIVWFHRMSDGSPNVLHRVVTKNEGWIVTRGDNTVTLDGPTINQNIKGFCGMIIY